MARAPCSTKTTRTPHACRYKLLLDTYSDRHVLGFKLLLFAGVIALCRAVLCCARDSVTSPLLTRTYSCRCCCMLVLYTLVQHQEKPPPPRERAIWKKKAQQGCVKRSRTCWTSLTLSAFVSGMSERESIATHGTTRHSTAQHRTARQGTTPHGTARCCPTPLS